MKKYLIVFAVAMLACACGGDDTNPNPEPPTPPTPPVEEASISLSSGEYTFTKAGGTSDEITVTSSADWELIGDDAVFKPSAKKGKSGDKVTFTAEGNKKAETFEEVFTFLCDGETATFTAKQLAGDEMTIPTQEFSAPIIGGRIFVEVKASGAYEYAVEDKLENAWLTKPAAVPAAAAALETTRAELVAAANDTGKAREAQVLFTLGDLSIPVVVKQAQNNVLKVEQGAATAFEVEKAGQTVEFVFQANFKPAVQITADDPGTWVTAGEPATESAEAGAVAYKLGIVVATNDGAPRNAVVVLSDPDNAALKIEVTIAQKGEAPVPEGSARIPDAKFRAKLFELGYIASADEELCELTEAGKTATMLNVGNSGITDLTGIEAFANVTNLMVFANQGITRLDLSKNQKITSLNINALPKLTYIDLGGISLNWFEPKNIQSESLTIISTGVIKNFECNGTNLKSVDFSQCTGFVDVKLQGVKKLEGNVDLHSCTNLESLTLNYVEKQLKLILPKSKEGAVTLSMGGDVNPQPEIVYE